MQIYMCTAEYTSSLFLSGDWRRLMRITTLQGDCSVWVFLHVVKMIPRVFPPRDLYLSLQSIIDVGPGISPGPGSSDIWLPHRMYPGHGHAPRPRPMMRLVSASLCKCAVSLAQIAVTRTILTSLQRGPKLALSFPAGHRQPSISILIRYHHHLLNVCKQFTKLVISVMDVFKDAKISFIAEENWLN